MSTNRTENYHLHAWEPGDDFSREEINENFAVMDSVMKQKVEITVGTYTGDGTAQRPIILGFQPQAVIVEFPDSRRPNSNMQGGLALRSYPLRESSSSVSAIAITGNGFQVSTYGSTTALNNNGGVYRYIAFAW